MAKESPMPKCINCNKEVLKAADDELCLECHEAYERGRIAESERCASLIRMACGRDQHRHCFCQNLTNELAQLKR